MTATCLELPALDLGAAAGTPDALQRMLGYLRTTAADAFEGSDDDAADDILRMPLDADGICPAPARVDAGAQAVADAWAWQSTELAMATEADVEPSRSRGTRSPPLTTSTASPVTSPQRQRLGAGAAGSGTGNGGGQRRGVAQHESVGSSSSSSSKTHADASAAVVLPPGVAGRGRRPFEYARQLLGGLGLVAWGPAHGLRPLQKCDKLLRELKNVDASGATREQHKVAVIYVGAGQRAKAEIIGAAHASEQFERFVAGLGWPVALETHEGYTGRVTAQQFPGCSLPYYATATREVCFHVTTMLHPPGVAQVADAMQQWDTETTELVYKKRWVHVGNDAVHVVWSEDDRLYTPSQLQTRFGELTIVVYPMSNGLFRVSIIHKTPLAFTGPLFDGAVVDGAVLPSLVRCTAVNADRALRRKLVSAPFFQARRDYLSATVQRLQVDQSFEQFSANLIAPAALLSRGGRRVSTRGAVGAGGSGAAAAPLNGAYAGRTAARGGHTLLTADNSASSAGGGGGGGVMAREKAGRGNSTARNATVTASMSSGARAAALRSAAAVTLTSPSPAKAKANHSAVTLTVSDTRRDSEGTALDRWEASHARAAVEAAGGRPPSREAPARLPSARTTGSLFPARGAQDAARPVETRAATATGGASASVARGDGKAPVMATSRSSESVVGTERTVTKNTEEGGSSSADVEMGFERSGSLPSGINLLPGAASDDSEDGEDIEV